MRAPALALLPLVLSPAAAFAEDAAFAIRVVEAETEAGTVDRCRFVLEAENLSDTEQSVTVVVEHRLEKGSMSAMIAPKNGAFGRESSIFLGKIAPGGSAKRKASFLGATCEHVEAVWLNPGCGTGCVEAGADSVLPVAVATEEELAERAAPKPPAPLDGDWAIRAADGTPLGSLEMDHEQGKRPEGSYVLAEALCGLDGAECGATAMEGDLQFPTYSSVVGGIVNVPMGPGSEAVQLGLVWNPKSGEGELSFEGRQGGGELVTHPVTVARP